MLFPLKHENMTARRWPVITLGLIVLNCLVFLSTHGPIDRQDAAFVSVERRVLILAAQHPELSLPPEAAQFVSDFQTWDPADWSKMQRPDYITPDDWYRWMRGVNDPKQLQEEMNSLAGDYETLKARSILQRYAFVPAHPRPIAYLTSEFLHGGWLHLIGNMLFLWLAGFVLEDAWGRPLFLAFCLTAGIFATQLDAWASPGSLAPTLGASGAIAGLMGGFLIRFPKLKIRLVWVGGWLWRLWVPAWGRCRCGSAWKSTTRRFSDRATA